MPATSKSGQLFMGDGQSRVNWYPVTLAENVFMTEGGDDLSTALDDKITAPSSPSSGQFLLWNGSAWVAASLPVYNGGVS